MIVSKDIAWRDSSTRFLLGRATSRRRRTSGMPVRRQATTKRSAAELVSVSIIRHEKNPRRQATKTGEANGVGASPAASAQEHRLSSPARSGAGATAWQDNAPTEGRL